MTLVEILVAIAVIGILVGIATPSFTRSIGESQLEGDCGKIAGQIQWTRMLAVKSGRRSFMLFDGAARSWSIWLDNDNDLSLDVTKDSLVSRDSLGNSVRFGFDFTPPATVPVLGASAPTTGFGAVSSSTTIDDCQEGVAFPASPGGPATWASGSSEGKIMGCGGATADLSMGTLYLTTTRSTNRAYALVFNHATAGVESFAIRRYRWLSGSTWELL